MKSALVGDDKDRKRGGMFGDDGVTGFHPALLSGLVLAGANRAYEAGGGDGVLTVLEVAELDLRNVDLAVLSACETGLGKVAAGEGILGLQAAFQVAGAKSVVASLWSVDDEATRKLMERFYENLWQKKMLRGEAAPPGPARDASRRTACAHSASRTTRRPPAAAVLLGRVRTGRRSLKTLVF